MRKKHNMQLRKKVLATAITASLGIASASLPGTAVSDTYVWGALTAPASDTTTCSVSPEAAAMKFTMLEGAGNALANTSIPIKGNNQFQTSTCGTLTYDTVAESGTVEIVAFDFFSGTSPAVAAGITINKLTNAEANGSDTTLLGNMLFNWNGINGIPVSLVWEAQGLMGEMDGTPSTFTLNADGSINGTPSALTGTGASPASDGTYVGNVVDTVVGPGGNPGYLGLGPVPVATTAWNTTLAPGCTIGVDSNYADNAGGGCMGVAPSGEVPLQLDTATNNIDYVANTGGSTGGNPMADGPFSGMSATFDFTSMKLVSFTDTTAPVITLSGVQGSSISHTEGESYVEDGATCSDAAPLNTNLNGSVAIGGTPPDPLTVAGSPFTVTYDCQDASLNNAVQLTRTITVTAAGAPVISLVGGAVNHECATPYVDAGASCVDVPDGAITPTLSTAGLNVNTTGLQSVTWSCTDSATTTTTLDRAVTVVDTTLPVVTLNPPSPQTIESSTAQNPASYTDPLASVTDSCDGASPDFGFTSGNVIMTVPDTGAATVPYDLIYDATDAAGNLGTVTRTVNVTRSQPVIIPGSGVTLSLGENYTEPGIDIIDAQDGDLTGVTTSGVQSNGVTVTIDASAVDTSTEGSYTVTYTVTDSDGNLATLATRDVAVGIFAPDSNFTMLDSAGNLVGGTNDVAFDWDGTSFNTSEADTNFDLMTIKSIKPQTFFNFVWTAHHIRIFDNQSGTTPKTLTFDTTCTAAQLEAGMGGPGQDCNGPFTSGQTQQFLTLTIPPGKIGAHILFDWNLTTNIDVVNVWEPNGVWDRHGTTGETNKLHDGGAGLPPKEDTTWKLVSVDLDGDNINGTPMIDGPFNGFNANFNAGPQDKGETKAPIVITAPDTSIGSGQLPALALSIWGLIAGLAGLLGLRRFTKQK